MSHFQTEAFSLCFAGLDLPQAGDHGGSLHSEGMAGVSSGNCTAAADALELSRVCGVHSHRDQEDFLFCCSDSGALSEAKNTPSCKTP